MTTITHPAPALSLRFALKLDAVVTGANGASYLVAAAPLEDLLGLDAVLLRGLGAFLLVFAGAVWLTATRREIPRPAVLAIVDANLVWALGSALAAAAQWGSPTTAGTVWIVLQALTVAGFAALQLASRNR
ncbi:MAG TPA: hypothetical protein VGR12_04090 [Solirubrobacteraceae bacterium]|nr:hypothetical protein [Solirubrobacteraceae bacterium]